MVCCHLSLYHLLMKKPHYKIKPIIKLEANKQFWHQKCTDEYCLILKPELKVHVGMYIYVYIFIWRLIFTDICDVKNV